MLVSRLPVPAIAKTLENRHLLITGTTGFLAKVFLEKLLRVAPEIKRVSLLIRARDVRHGGARIENDIFSSPLFNVLKQQHGDGFEEFIRSKVRFVIGDTVAPRLGLNELDHIRLTEDLDFFVNSAASTEFTAAIDETVRTNAVSVDHISRFVAESIKCRLLHVSTCYVNETGQGSFAETPAEIPKKGRALIPVLPNGGVDISSLFIDLEKASAESGSSKEALTSAALRFAQDRGWHNSYTFTKWLGEKILESRGKQITAAIIRPSIIESCWQDPMPGWIEGLKVADPLIYGVGTDRVKFFPGRLETVLDLIPVDRVVNAIFLALGELSRTQQPGCSYYQVCSGSENPLSLRHITGIVRSAFAKKVLSHRCMVPPTLFWSVANSIDGLQSFLGRFNRRAFHGRRKLRKLLDLARIYEPYTNLRCVFENTKTLQLWERAAAEDQILFPVSVRSLDWSDYIGRVHIPGLKAFVIEARANQSNPKPQPRNSASRAS